MSHCWRCSQIIYFKLAIHIIFKFQEIGKTLINAIMNIKTGFRMSTFISFNKIKAVNNGSPRFTYICLAELIRQ
jgi:hypothetical protein